MQKVYILDNASIHRHLNTAFNLSGWAWLHIWNNTNENIIEEKMQKIYMVITNTLNDW